MGGSSKNSTSTQSVQIPQAVLDRYQSANDSAATAASQPFQQYSTDPNAFVAPLNSTQNSGVAGTNAYADTAQPYYGAATQQLEDSQGLGAGMVGSAQTALLNAKNAANGYNTTAGNYYGNAYSGAQPYNAAAGNLIGGGLSAAQPLNSEAQSGFTNALAGASPYNAAATDLTAASAGAVNPTALNSQAINQYLSPYLGTVLGGTAAQLNQDNQKAMSGQTGSAISQGAFGGDRAGIAAATLAGQQQLANAQIYSGILNTGYNNALGAAQQQQGVGLGAAQANRTALSGAGQQLANIGNLNYTQGTGTASNLAALGQQEYGQGLGAGQAVQGLGQQVFGQGNTTGASEQGLGQQVFGQGLSTSQQEAALANQEYSMGANTSQQLAGLGAGAQTAGLQGAQAQLAAGQVGQQTAQAGDTALYNQFLQQQSYPFQTAQFLANVAEGTGSLSGSTTTTTQPGGFFSDERLKEDIKKIGKTFDGQVIYSFKYKGDPRTQVGLMAQDVEKRTPDAVGESYGYKTVDYERATDKAAERGHFAGGGSPMLPGLSPADMQAILAAQEQTYAPFSQAGGLYGGQATGAPRGGSSYVPQASLPVSHLAVAGGLAPQKSGMSQASDMANMASKAAPYAQKAEDWIKDKWDARNDNTMSANENDLSTGGLVPAKRYASGGMPYDQQTGLDIPDETPTSKLQTAGDLPGQASGMDNTKDAVGTALAVAKIAAMFMNRGGRAGFADGGSPDDTDFATASDGGSDSTPWYLKPIPSPQATGHAIMDGLRGAASAYSANQDKRRVQSSQFADAADNSPVPYVGTPVGAIKTAAPRAVRAAPSGGLAPAVAATDAELPTISAPAPADVGGLAPQTNTSVVHPDAPSPSAPPSNPGVLSRVGDAIKSNVGDYASGLKHGDAQNWLPLLAAIGAAGTAPTVHPGVALAAGLGAGAQSYMGTKKALADVAQTQAQSGNIGAHTTQTQQANAINYYKLAQAGIIKADPKGPIVDPATGTHYVSAQGESTIPGGAPAPNYKYLGPHGQEALSSSAQQFAKDSPALGITPNEGNITTSNKIIGDVQQSAADAQTAKTIQNEQAAALLSPDRKGILSQGALAPVFQPYVEKFNSAVTDLGHGAGATDDWTIKGLGDQQIAHKLQLGQAAMQSTGAGQHAYQALSDFTQLAPGGALDPHAAATLMAQNAVAATKAIDQRDALAEAKQHAPNGNYEAQDIMTAFDRDNPPAVYNAMRDAVAGIYQNPAYATIHTALAKPGTPDYQKTINTLNAYGKQHGIPNFARVFTGG